MKLALFITRKIAFGQKRSFSRFIIQIATIAVAISIAVMIIAFAMVNGFQKEISAKVFGFWGHIHITPFTLEGKFEEEPIDVDEAWLESLRQFPGVKHIQRFASKAGIMKTEEDIEGIVLKGISTDFDWSFFRDYLYEGSVFSPGDSAPANQILISKYTADRLKLKPGDELILYFIQKPARVRKFTVSGIYNSGLKEFDKFYALVDIRHIQRLNGWKNNQVGGFEVFVNDPAHLKSIAEEIYMQLPPELYAYTIDEIYPNIFDWLQLQNMNKIVILILMVIVASMNMITALLILIIERSGMIGILKALGATDGLIMRIFIVNAIYILGLGLIAGNCLGIGICLIQKEFGIIRLPEESYYLSIAPVDLDPLVVGAINIATLIICTLITVLPAMVVSRVNPVKVIHFR